MVVSAFLFAVSGEFKLEVGHMGLAAVGCMAIILGVFVSEANLAIFSGGLIFVNIFAAIVWFFFK